MTSPQDTTADMLIGAAEIGRASGLRHVYAGNLPGQVGDREDTRCHSCGEVLISRDGYHVRSYRLTAEGRCPSCHAAIPGRWSTGFEGQIASLPFRARIRDSRLRILNIR